jgi:hypothetical protein
MSSRLIFIFAAASVLAGCKSLDGSYQPGCPAYAGDRVRLHAGAFEWDRFTDAVPVDADGNRVDPFPDYPKKGNYRLENGSLILTFADGSETTLYPDRHRERVYLLTETQADAWVATGRWDDCALVRSENN